MLALGWFSNRTGTSVDDGARKSNNWLDQWQSGKLSNGSRGLVLSARFSIVNWRSRPVAKSANYFWMTTKPTTKILLPWQLDVTSSPLYWFLLWITDDIKIITIWTWSTYRWTQLPQDLIHAIFVIILWHIAFHQDHVITGGCYVFENRLGAAVNAFFYSNNHNENSVILKQ